MRSIRRAALAGATAASLVLGAATVAVADDADAPVKDEKTSSASKITEGSSEKDGDKDSDTTANKDGSSGDLKTTSSKIGTKLDADQPVNGEQIWGSSKDLENAPKWARVIRGITIAGVVGSVLGLIVFPAYNFLVFNHIIPGAPR